MPPPISGNPPPYAVIDPLTQLPPTYDGSARPEPAPQASYFFDYEVVVVQPRAELPPEPPPLPERQKTITEKAMKNILQGSLICNAVGVPSAMVTMGIGVAAAKSAGDMTGLVLFAGVPVVSSIVMVGCTVGVAIAERFVRQEAREAAIGANARQLEGE